MNIIADTNIWYYLGQDDALFNSVKEAPIAPTYVNIYELSKSENVVDKEELVRNAIQKLFHFKKNAIFEPPFIYLAKLHNQFEYDIDREIGHWLKFTEEFAKGESILEDKKDEFKKRSKEIHSELSSGAEFFNSEAERIRQNIVNKKDQRAKQTIPITGQFINFLVETTTDKKYNILGLEENRIELLIKTVDCFFKTMEVSKMKFQPNDWFDFAILAYVHPGDKYWTRETKWKNLIREAGCENYLYEQ